MLPVGVVFSLPAAWYPLTLGAEAKWLLKLSEHLGRDLV